MKLNIDFIYPIGSIYMSINSVNPEQLFGGVWEQIKDRFLLASGDNHIAGTIGGEEKHTLTYDEMPSHMHHIEYNGTQVGTNISTTGWYSRPVVNMEDSKLTRDIPTLYTGYAGGSQPHNNMPPYLTVYMWKRNA